MLPQKLLDVKRVERIAREQRPVPEQSAAATYHGDSKVDIRCGDFKDTLADIESESVSLILTDPPYSSDYMHLWEQLSTFAAEKLKPGGLLVTYSGQFHLPDVMTALGGQLGYVWTISTVGCGPSTPIHARRIHSRWKPVIVYCKPPFTSTEWTSDLYNGDGPEKDGHKWQQSLDEALHFVESYSIAGDLVVDPFVGSGTNAVACLRLGRSFIGCDIDPTAIETAIGRIEQEEDTTEGHC